MQVIHMASEIRMKRTIRKFIFEGQARSAEQTLQVLRQELVEAVKDLQEIETSFRTLHDLYSTDSSDEALSESSSILE